MPELPEVETVRAGLQRWAAGRVIAEVEVRHPRAVRRHIPGADDLVARLRGRRVEAAVRRGKYLWLPLGDASAAPASGAPLGDCLVAHLGMSGQFLVQPADEPEQKHLHVRITFTDGGPELRFVDQRTFGGVLVDRLIPDGLEGTQAAERPDMADPWAAGVPSLVAHIARDPIDPRFDEAAFVARLRTRRSAVKRALLDQTLVSGIGNIYADESLWRVRLNGERLANSLRRAQAVELLAQVRAVLSEALVAGGTSFDSLYVNVNGESGYFDRSLNVYGREHEPCPRCGALIRRAAFMNRSSYYCPVCQRRPSRTVAGAP